MLQIDKINFAITNKCNLNCTMCSIWKEKPNVELDEDTIKKIINSKYISNSPDIALTGGEPFLHTNIEEISNQILKSKANSLQTITTNGTLSNEIEKYLFSMENKLPDDFVMNISMDGINCHDKIRGESLNKIINTIKILKEKNIVTEIKFTILKENYLDIIPTFKFCRDNGLKFKVKLGENASLYTNKLFSVDNKFDAKQKDKIIRQLEFIKSKTSDKLFLQDAIDFLKNSLALKDCKTPSNRIFVMPNGDIFSCIHNESLGNIKTNSFDSIVRGTIAENIREKTSNGCNLCVAYHGKN